MSITISKNNIISLLDAVEQSLKVVQYRNEYEFNNAYESNKERLISSEATLKRITLNCSESDLFQKRIRQLNERNEHKHSSPHIASNITEHASWMKHLEDNIDFDEIEISVKSKKPKKEKKEKKIKENKNLPPAALITTNKKDDMILNEKGPSTNNDVIVSKVLCTIKNTSYDAIPSIALEGKCTVKQIPNSPCVELHYDVPIKSPQGDDATVCVIAYRVVVAALWRGTPQVPAVSKEIKPLDSLPVPSSISTDINASNSDSDEEVVIDEDDQTNRMNECDVTRVLSEKLVLQYEESEAAADDLALEFAHGRDVPLQIIHPTRHFLGISKACWAVLMCHGGCFAGGIFVSGNSIAHRAFRRYVVRKKQGGMQSKCDKTGGCMNSAGSQIRRHNEIKWMVMVRDTLLEWRGLIDAAWVILYVAPGPTNRSLLTNFSGLPLSAIGAKSPVNIQDPRVRSVPMTTHEPSFSEVQRIYQEISKCSLQYMKIE